MLLIWSYGGEWCRYLFSKIAAMAGWLRDF